MTDHRLKMNFELTSFLSGVIETAVQVCSHFSLLTTTRKSKTEQTYTDSHDFIELGIRTHRL